MKKSDAEIVERIMGWTRVPDPMSSDGKGSFWKSHEGRRVQGSDTLHYSTDISDAWCVVETLSSHPDEAVRQRFLNHLLRSGLLVSREIAAKNICLAALAAITDDRRQGENTRLRASEP